SSIDGLVPYEPGKPVEAVQRELGLERVVKLASNEGPFPPFPAALEAMERAALELNRYPDGGAWTLRTELAERHGVTFDELIVGAGADGIIDLLAQATLDPGDEIVCGWPSFPSYVLTAMKLGAEARRVPLRDHTYDLDGLLAAIGPRTKLVYVCHPNNPTGTANSRAELLAFLDQLPEHVLCVLDQAYFEYIDEPDYVDGLDLFREGRRIAVLRTFSKIYGLAGLRVGWAVASADVVTATSKVRRAFDVAATAQAAALASLDDAQEIARRRLLNATGRDRLAEILGGHGLEPAEPARGNFLFVDVGGGRELFERLLREGVIVRPVDGFGAPEAIRVTVGTPEENEVFGVALGHVLSGVS
ncbi:MAG TPA: histidinol-phosphate transaminase, partial [Gaiellaceae bacterium]|nr:histidinol-phosphate transaminase [Gaiellaceae bacterium]